MHDRTLDEVQKAYGGQDYAVMVVDVGATLQKHKLQLSQKQLSPVSTNLSVDTSPIGSISSSENIHKVTGEIFLVACVDCIDIIQQ